MERFLLSRIFWVFRIFFLIAVFIFFFLRGVLLVRLILFFLFSLIYSVITALLGTLIKSEGCVSCGQSASPMYVNTLIDTRICVRVRDLCAGLRNQDFRLRCPYIHSRNFLLNGRDKLRASLVRYMRRLN